MLNSGLKHRDVLNTDLQQNECSGSQTVHFFYTYNPAFIIFLHFSIEYKEIYYYIAYNVYTFISQVRKSYNSKILVVRSNTKMMHISMQKSVSTILVKNFYFCCGFLVQFVIYRVNIIFDQRCAHGVPPFLATPHPKVIANNRTPEMMMW